MQRIPAGTGPVRLTLLIADSADEAAAAAARILAQAITAAAVADRRCVLGLPTGASPVPVYRRLVEEHRAGRLSFRHVTTFNLDEYHPIAPDDPNSYRRFMCERLFDQVDLEPEAAHVPCGNLPSEEIPAHAAVYEAAIAAAGGIDVQLLGLGGNGHIGFNEPGSARSSRTRLVTLDERTRRAAAAAFGGLERVPRRGVTMGLDNILAARRVVLLATGAAKAAALARAVEGLPAEDCPASLLQGHPDVLVIADPAAAAQLDAVRRPWRVGQVEWTPRRIRAAVADAALRAGKPILALAEADYRRVGLDDLLNRHGPVEELNLGVFSVFHDTITGWPGGKPPAQRRPGDIPRPDDEVQPKTVVVFSPHPDDDVIGMGGTIARLVQHGHRVHLAVQTSGHRGVSDADLAQYLAYVEGFTQLAGADGPGLAAALARTRADAGLRREARLLLRRTETDAAAARCGVERAFIHHLDLPFYEQVDGLPGKADAERILALLDELQPHQIYAAGDLGDPHGTHRRCLEVLASALDMAADRPWRKRLHCWLYRGAWDAWPPEAVDRAVPLTEADLLRKRQAIIRHQSQKDTPPFPGDDVREFWQRAEDRARAAAESYDRLGLPHYQAMETFAAWDGVTLP